VRRRLGRAQVAVVVNEHLDCRRSWCSPSLIASVAGRSVISIGPGLIRGFCKTLLTLALWFDLAASAVVFGDPVLMLAWSGPSAIAVPELDGGGLRGTERAIGGGSESDCVVVLFGDVVDCWRLVGNVGRGGPLDTKTAQRIHNSPLADFAAKLDGKNCQRRWALLDRGTLASRGKCSCLAVTRIIRSGQGPELFSLGLTDCDLQRSPVLIGSKTLV